MPYIVAGAHSVFTNVHRYADKPDNIYHQIIKDFMKRTNSGYLWSFGNGLSDESKDNVKIKGRYGAKYVQIFNQPRFLEVTKAYDITNLVMDSGGYQAQSGYLSVDDCYEFIDEYKYFIEHTYNKFRNFFALDLIPNGLTYDKLLDLNMKSYEALASLPEEARKKIIFVYHFFTPKVFEAWKTITDTYFDKFGNYFAFGGLAANDTTSVVLPISVFAIGIVQIVYQAKKRNMNNIKIHVLGAASYRDVMMYQLYRAVIKEYHNIDIEITYDSSLVFKQVQKSRRINVIEPDFTNLLLDLRENVLHAKVLRHIPNTYDVYSTTEEIMKENFENMLSFIDPKYSGLTKDINIYEEKEDGSGRSLSRAFTILSILFCGWQYNALEEKCYNYVSKLMPLLRTKPFEFYEELNQTLLKLNQGKLSYKFKDKIMYIRNTIDYLIALDPEMIENVVRENLSSCEIVDKGIDTDSIADMDFL